jgi:SnoaL-like domain
MPVDLQELLDKQEIYDVLARYVRGENRDDKELWLQTFWPDSECHNQIYQNWPVGSSDDPDAWEVSSAEEWVEKYWCALEAPNPPFFNMLGQVLIEVDGDVAFAETYFVSYSQGMQQPSWARPQGGDGEGYSLKEHRAIESTDGRRYMRIRGGRYCDRLERRDGVWKVAYRIVTDDWSFWADCTEKVSGLGTHPGMSGKGDPLYAVLGTKATGTDQESNKSGE